MAKITIFGLAGTGTSSVGKTFAKKYNHEFISTGSLFRSKAESLGLTLYEFQDLCAKDDSYDRALDAEIAQYGKTHTMFVVESRMAWYFIPDSFKVKLICSDEERLLRVATRDQISIEEAREKTYKREHGDPERYKQMYGVDRFAPDELFDCIIDTTSISIDEIVDIIAKKVFNQEK